MPRIIRRAVLAMMAVAVVALTGAGVALAHSGQAASRDAHAARLIACRTWPFKPNVLITSARNMGCRSARREMRRYNAPIFAGFTTPGGFSSQRVSGAALGGQ